ncbi:omega-amidase, chloroplastic-like [Phoenix dactylifera]|uniref:Omega-amidase, chloroplastic-like n=1 Tax=Phoenix dactylifera TaxID=42345 RepID=A0A8B9AVA8_PHODC|nr:omega-amidase, chloroplastic-like [Phoenix dactylifera]
MASAHKPEDCRAPPALQLPAPPVSKFKIGLCQLAVTAEKEKNISHARKAIEEAAGKGAKLVLLPISSAVHFMKHGYIFFDIDILGKISFKESKTLTAGQHPTIVDTGARLLCGPGAFNMTTGPLDWELLQRARAADNQFGEVVATAEHEEAIIVEEIDLSLIELIIKLHRLNLPLEKQRCGDLYQLVDVQSEVSIYEKVALLFQC